MFDTPWPRQQADRRKTFASLVAQSYVNRSCASSRPQERGGEKAGQRGGGDGGGEGGDGEEGAAAARGGGRRGRVKGGPIGGEGGGKGGEEEMAASTTLKIDRCSDQQVLSGQIFIQRLPCAAGVLSAYSILGIIVVRSVVVP